MRHTFDFLFVVLFLLPTSATTPFFLTERLSKVPVHAPTKSGGGQPQATEAEDYGAEVTQAQALRINELRLGE